ncbi:MAG: toxin [Comamonadaceae bacterium CG_4_9_14_3_um_filter_60_33]|nr:MAG: toxin [Comamonadaceae bacterium CG_4_10_14_3_um_filter_60_42]PJB44832.1 MAG: toxin [Comamonadaceae bacterium CG_4_9_14_3_um_filter_60_33]
MKIQKIFNWNAEKNQLLIRERGISFERIVFEIAGGNELAVLEHLNQEKYPGQKISMVQVDDYVFAVPFIETEAEIFLKTIIPSRKATRQYRSNS